MKTLFIVLLVLGIVACEKEKKIEVKYIDLLESTRIRKVPEIIKDQFCPKVGDKFEFQTIYAVFCNKQENIFYIKSLRIQGRFLTVKEYFYMNKQLMLIYDADFVGTYYDEDVRVPDNLSGDRKIAKSIHGYGLINEESYHYEADETGKFQVKYKRIFDDIEKVYKLQKYENGGFENLIGEDDIKSYDYENKTPEFKFSKDEFEAKEKEVKIAMQIFEAYDLDYNLYSQLEKYRKGDKLKPIKLYSKKQLDFEKKLNIDRDFEIPYHRYYNSIVNRER